MAGWHGWLAAGWLAGWLLDGWPAACWLAEIFEMDLKMNAILAQRVCFFTKCIRGQNDSDKRFQNVPAGKLILKTDLKMNAFCWTNELVF